MQGWLVVSVALGYLLSLFAVASYGDRRARRAMPSGGRPGLYALALGVYCTSWTFFGSVGLAATAGFDFLTIYIGAGAMIAFGMPVLRRVVALSKSQNITSVADFMGARYGKSRWVGAVVTLIAIIGALPYIALQLKAVASSLSTMLAHVDPAPFVPAPVIGDLAFFVAVLLAVFAILFGTRQIDATEHHEGLMLAVATESVVKLLAFLIVGAYVTFALFDGPADIWARAKLQPEIAGLFTRGLDGGAWLAMIGLSAACILLLPRQFHVLVVENRAPGELDRARWLFPLYLVAINLFVVPIAIAGLLTFGTDGADRDMFVLSLPLSAGADAISLIAFLGGLSAATAMVIVATVALSIMVGNELIMPLVLGRRAQAASEAPRDMGALLLAIRRGAIFAVLLLAYAYYRLSGGGEALASIGFLSFTAIAQLAPAFFGGLLWRRATARGAVAGMVAGIAVWAYTLLLPSLATTGAIAPDILAHGPAGIGLLRPQVLFFLEFQPLTHGVLWSMTANVAAFLAVSLLRAPEPTERAQARLFVPHEPVTAAPGLRRLRTAVSVGALEATVAGYLGAERTRRAFDEFAASRTRALDRRAEADLNLLRFSERLLAAAIGAASSRLVLSLLLRRENVSPKAALRLLDDASAALQYNRDLLRTALDQVEQGIAVFDRDLRLTFWNRQFRSLLGLPPAFGVVGIALSDILRSQAERGEFGEDWSEAQIDQRIADVVLRRAPYLERLRVAGTILEVRMSDMPDGGLVLTYTDVTERIRSQEALARANETLERRVQERTKELTRLNAALIRATAEAEDANLSKTRFLAAAGHDVMQPLNAARLYLASLTERERTPDGLAIMRDVDACLESVEDILGALLDISRLDSGVMKVSRTRFPVDDLLREIVRDFEPIARAKGLRFTVVPSRLWVRSDRGLLRRVVQNLVSNAVKYTPEGRVLIGCRRRGDTLALAVHDTGPGIPADQHALIFQEFQRLDTPASLPGLGLGLSIVERICRVLDHPVTLVSHPGRGSAFAVEVPLARPVRRIAHSGAARPARPASSLAGTTVLCVDNDRRILDAMEALLTGWGCTVRSASSASEALEIARDLDGALDLLLVDYHLDEGTGIYAALQIRNQTGRDMPAVLLTADRAPKLREEAQENGLPVLYKPVKPAALRAVMAQHQVKRHAAE